MRVGLAHKLRAMTMVVAVLAVPGAAAAQSTGYVPLDDPAYRDVALLRARGWIGREPVGQRPYTRHQVELMVREALATVSNGGAGSASPGDSAALHEALDRLTSRFGTTPSAWDITLRRASLRGTRADSPARSIPTSYTDSTRIIGRVNPLLDGDLGRVREPDGWTGAAEVAVEATLGGLATLYLHPRAWITRSVDGEQREDAGVHEAYLRVLFGDLFIEAGRNHGLMGQGERVGPLLSTNARGLDMVRVGNEGLIRLPWILDRLGPTRMTFLFADLGSDRVIPHSKVLMGKVSFRPAPNLELGMSYLNQQFGEGAPEADLSDRLLDMFLPFPFIHFEEISERMYGLDARYRRPEQGLEIYLDGMATDFNGGRLHEVFWEEAAWLGGLRLDGLGRQGRLGLGIEFQRNGIRPYTHHHFYTGMTLDGLVLGSPLGPHATQWSLRGSWLGAAHALDAELRVGWFSGDLYRGNDLDGTKFRWNKVAEREDEVRVGASATWRGPDRSGMRPYLRAGVERTTNFGFTGTERWSAAVEAGVDWTGR